MQIAPCSARRRALSNEMPKDLLSRAIGVPRAMCRWSQAARAIGRALRRIQAGETAGDQSPRSSSRIEILFLLATLGLVASAMGAIVTGAGSGHILILLFAGAAGAFGATASILVRRSAPKSAPTAGAKVDEPTWSSLVLSVSLGAGAACLFYWLARLGVLGGGLFPVLSPGSALPDTAPVISVADFTKLMLSCFAAGFAERLLPLFPPKSAGRN